jgi:hypothetical protein
MTFRRVLVGHVVIVSAPTLAACGSYDDGTERQAGLASTGGLAEDLGEPRSTEACVGIWNGPTNVRYRERAVRLGPDASVVVVATELVPGSEDEVDPTGVHGCLFLMNAWSADEIADSGVVAYVEGEWHDLEVEESLALQPTLAGSAIADVVVAPDGSLSEGPADARLSKAAYLLSVYRVVETYEPRASELFTMLVLDGETLALPEVECGRRALEFHGQLETIVSEVEKLNPPEEIEALQAAFLAAARESVDAVGDAAAAATRGELACGRPMNLRIYGLPSTERAEHVLDELAEHGYPLRGE